MTQENGIVSRRGLVKSRIVPQDIKIRKEIVLFGFSLHCTQTIMQINDFVNCRGLGLFSNFLLLLSSSLFSVASWIDKFTTMPISSTLQLHFVLCCLHGFLIPYPIIFKMFRKLTTEFRFIPITHGHFPEVVNK